MDWVLQIPEINPLDGLTSRQHRVVLSGHP